MVTVGGVISGYWPIGRLLIASMPTTTITIEITIAVTGLRIKVSAIIFLFGHWSLVIGHWWLFSRATSIPAYYIILLLRRFSCSRSAGCNGLTKCYLPSVAKALKTIGDHLITCCYS